MDINYTIFPKPLGAWVGDIMATSDNETIELNYLYHEDYHGVGFHPIYRMSTSDFINYKSDEKILSFGTELESHDIAIGTGSFIKANDGKYHIFYTGHNPRADEFGIDKEIIMHAISNDNISYEKLPQDNIYAPEGFDTNNFRDPQVIWVEEKNQYFMLVAAKKEDASGGVILKYTSKNLDDWSYEGIFYEQEELYFLECPDLFKLGDYYYLIFSWNNVTYYRIAENIEGEWSTPPIPTFDGDAFYAAKTVLHNDTRYLIGFIDRKEHELNKNPYLWAGNTCVYELVQHDDGTLGVKLPEELHENYFTEEYNFNAKNIIGNVDTDDEKYILKADEDISYVDLGALPQTMYMSTKINISAGAKAGFYFGLKDNIASAYPITLENNNIHYSHSSIGEPAKDFRNVLYYDFGFDKEHEITLIVENEIIVIYVDDKIAFSNRIYEVTDANFGLYVEKGSAEFGDLLIKTILNTD